jgi:hypothetical protein
MEKRKIELAITPALVVGSSLNLNQSISFFMLFNLTWCVTIRGFLFKILKLTPMGPTLAPIFDGFSDSRFPNSAKTAKCKFRVSSQLYFKFNVENEYAVKNGGFSFKTKVGTRFFVFSQFQTGSEKRL